MNILKRTKTKISKYRDENNFLKVKIQTLKTKNHALKTTSGSKTIIN
jgi:hypothetical protein